MDSHCIQGHLVSSSHCHPTQGRGSRDFPIERWLLRGVQSRGLQNREEPALDPTTSCKMSGAMSLTVPVKDWSIIPI